MMRLDVGGLDDNVPKEEGKGLGLCSVQQSIQRFSEPAGITDGGQRKKRRKDDEAEGLGGAEKSVNRNRRRAWGSRKTLGKRKGLGCQKAKTKKEGLGEPKNPIQIRQ